MNFYSSVTYMKDLQDTAARLKICDLRGSSFLITGASGLIGSYIVDVLMTANTLYNADIQVYALGRSRQRLSKRFEGIQTNKLVYIEQDLQTPLTFQCKADYIIHAASNAYPKAFREDPVGTMMSNLLGTYQLLEYARKNSTKRMLFVSTGEVYGQYDGQTEAYSEEYCGYLNILQARSCYPSSKRAAETLCCSYLKQYGVDVVIARPCHTYGPNTTSNDNRANVQFIDNACNGKDIVLKSAGDQMRSYCYIADCTAGILTVLTNGASGEAYNIAYSEAQVSIAQFAGIVAEQTGRKVVFEIPDDEALSERTTISRQVLDSGKLETLGWQGKFTVERGIAHILKVVKSL